jgi:hypothetical protein
MPEQAQDSLTDQFWRGHKLVIEAGFYDLADWMAARWFGPTTLAHWSNGEA